VAGVTAARIIERDGILENVREQGAYARAALVELGREHDLVVDVRGLGLMLGLELADGRSARAVQRAALERGLIVELGGRHDAVVRILPPLNVTRRTLDQALEILGAALADVGARS
jgi:diaminobutyrate-2-oxoglutarate transaminase